MKAADWIVDFLISKGVTDVFGLPGAVVLELLYAMDRRKPELTPHLNYHEQGAAFAACGYAQATGKLGVAYATRGPGMTNMLTAIADAYYDSVPTMFFTAHSSEKKKPEMRVENNQEIDTAAIAANVTKYAVRIDHVEDLQSELQKAYVVAITGRKGPVFLDIASSVFRQEMELGKSPAIQKESQPADVEKMAGEIAAKLWKAKRPVILIGGGVRQSGTTDLVRELAKRSNIPVLSSRTTHDILPNDPMYFGFIGSHGTRYSNFILSKADVIMALGNRLAFPANSSSFQPIVESSATIRVDVDKSEFLRDVPNSVAYAADLRQLLPQLLKKNLPDFGMTSWLSICQELRQELWQWDRMPVVDVLMEIMKAAAGGTAFVCDVGNHSFWVTNAYAYSSVDNRILYSGSFGTLGSGLPKAIGTYYSKKCPVICFTGDQGLQLNIQELQFISQHKLPIVVVVLNNCASGMIRDRQKNRPHFLHTTKNSGYGVPDLEAIASAYQMEFRRLKIPRDTVDCFTFEEEPYLVEVLVPEDVPLYPNLPIGNACQDLEPALPQELYDRLNTL